MDMNDIAELWSLPWHMLQRNLAAGIGDQRTLAGGDSCTAFAVKKPDIACSWLVRARQRAVARASA
jgi:hypothetical protein